MNPVTLALLKRLHEKLTADASEIEAFIWHWDEFEALVIAIFKSRQTTDEIERQYQAVHAWLQAAYPGWQPILKAYWPATRLAGKYTSQDPFLSLLSNAHAGEILGNWTALQTLPASREALNLYLVDLVGD